MSNISNRHQVNRFVAGKSAALSGQRLAKVGYKKTKDCPNPLPSVCVSVPQIVISPEDLSTYQESFTAIVRAALESAQDGIVRSLYESSGGTLSTISDDDIGIAQCLAYIEAENAGGRLTKESVSTWFVASLKENLTVVLADKLGFEEMNTDQMVTIEKHLKMYQERFEALSGGKTVLTEQQCKNLKNALALVSDDDSEVCKKLNARLDTMMKKEKIEDLLEL